VICCAGLLASPWTAAAVVVAVAVGVAVYFVRNG